MSHASSDLIVSASGIRGVVGRSLDPAVAARYGGAFGARVAGDGQGEARVTLARDSRVSGPLLADAVAAGLRAAGCSVRDLGVAATPTALLAVQDDPAARGGVIVTASHNPAEWNGLKLASSAGEFVSPEEGRAVQDAYESGPEWARWDGLGGREEAGGATDHHVERILGLDVLDPDAVAARDFRVALDTVRGAAGPVMTRLLERLGCRVEGRDLEPDGVFPRDPEPRPENLGGLGELVRETGADLGMAVDPDGDRLALVDGDGYPVGEDHTLAVAADHVLALRPGAAVTNLSSSRAIADVVERAGGRIHLAPVGEANVARRMREVDAVIGGEGNGGVMFPALHLTRDAPVAAALVLACLARKGTSLRELIDELPRYHLSKRRAPRPDGGMEEVYRRLESAAEGDPRRDRQDGLRLDWPDDRKWLHVRPSGTEPIVRVIAEAPTEDEAERLTDGALELIGPRPGTPGGHEEGD